MSLSLDADFVLPPLVNFIFQVLIKFRRHSLPFHTTQNPSNDRPYNRANRPSDRPHVETQSSSPCSSSNSQSQLSHSDFHRSLKLLLCHPSFLKFSVVQSYLGCIKHTTEDQWVHTTKVACRLYTS